MMPMVAKLVTYAAYEGHCSSNRRPRPPVPSGSLSSSTSSVTAIANTPSLNASRRAVSFSSRSLRVGAFIGGACSSIVFSAGRRRGGLLLQPPLDLLPHPLPAFDQAVEREQRVALAGRGRDSHARGIDQRLVRQALAEPGRDRKSTRLNSSHVEISYAVFCLKKK